MGPWGTSIKIDLPDKLINPGADNEEDIAEPLVLEEDPFGLSTSGCVETGESGAADVVGSVVIGGGVVVATGAETSPFAAVWINPVLPV